MGRNKGTGVKEEHERAKREGKKGVKKIRRNKGAGVKEDSENVKG